MKKKLEMSNHICTYFYQDLEDVGATYGNIFLPLEQRNLIYWQTVYTLFFTSIVQNKNKGIKYILFTNIKNFSLRKEIESLGVTIFDDLKLSHRNQDKWATVKFFFDVINYIEDSLYFNMGDGIVLLDTDCIALNDATKLFSYINQNSQPVAYVTGSINFEKMEFHGLTINSLIEIYKKTFSRDIKIQDTIGGEFFSFNKGSGIKKIRKNYEQLLESFPSRSITTEEQILTMLNADEQFISLKWSIYRVWTTYRNKDVHPKFYKFPFLHLPAEKTHGLARLFRSTINESPIDFQPAKLNKLILKCIPLNRLVVLYLYKFSSDFIGKIKKVLSR